jgi:hypothetical protein
MKVLKEGNWKNPWSTQATCTEKSCGAQLLVEEADVMPVDYGTGYFAQCPICHCRVIVDDLPLRLRRILDPKRKVSTGSAWD